MGDGVNNADDVIVLDGTRKEFGDFVAVDRADFTIQRGEFFSLLGPSGCGKTTLLKMIAGFERPTAGRVLLEGVDVSNVPPHERNVNTVFQQYALFPHMSVYDNVAFGLRAKKVAGDETRRRAMEMLEIVRLAEFAAASAGADVGWPAAAGRAGPGAGQPPERPAPRRAARRARPQAPRGDADRAQADPARGRHHVRVRHPRPGRGAHDERPHRRHEQGQGRADRHARGDLRRAGEHLRRRIHRIGQPAARDAGQRRRRAGTRAPRQRHGGRDDRRDARPARRPGDGDAAAGAAEPACRRRGRRPGRVWRRAAGDLPRAPSCACSSISATAPRWSPRSSPTATHGVAANRRADRPAAGGRTRRTCCAGARPSSAPRPPTSTRCRPRWRARKSSPSRATPRRRRSADSAGGRSSSAGRSPARPR